jgi:hypothetical protein
VRDGVSQQFLLLLLLLLRLHLLVLYSSLSPAL